RDGNRRPAPDGKELQQHLRQAGILLPDLRETDPARVWFFHDLMQSYLTAYGLWRIVQKKDDKPPTMEPEDSWVGWTAEGVLLRAAADAKFAGAKADLLISDASELLQMCVAVFEGDLQK